MKRRIILSIAALIVLCGIVGACILNGTIRLNSLWIRQYKIRGIDVSHYQGEIDWKVIEEQKIQFAFIKATEGSKTKDRYFEANWKDAKDTKITVGAYHFFSFESKGKKQAKNFIDTVPIQSGMLPPVVDVELYGRYSKYLPDKAQIVKELKTMLNALEKHYGEKPILYTTMKTYKKYISGNFIEYPLWIRNVYYKPNFTLNRKWTFWQYSNRTKLEGYQGKEAYIDMNAFYGTKAQFKKLLLK